MGTRWHCPIVLCVIVLSWSLSAGAVPLGAAITYQGQLKQSGAPYAGTADLRLTLYDAVSGGAVIAGPVTLTNVSVIAGLFTVQVDFGAPVPGGTIFGSDARWMLIEVRTPAGSGSFAALSPRQAVTATPNAIFASKPWVTSGLNVSYTAGNVGIGTASPVRPLEIASGALRFSSALGDVEFTEAADLTAFATSLNPSGNAPALRVATGTALPVLFTVLNNGKVGIGTAAPTQGKLHVVYSGGGNSENAINGFTNSTAGAGVYGENTAALGKAVAGKAAHFTATNYGGYFETESILGRGVYGWANSTSGGTYGVLGGSNSPVGYAVYAAGNFAASGAKSFRIDHPDDPANRYLLHYSAESPDVINFYSGNVTLDKAGEAAVELPPYFAKINREPRYTLTAVGSPMPTLHVAEEIPETALAAGAKAEPAQAAAICTFRIAGGTAGGKVSWRVDAVRNDRWMRHSGAPIETLKVNIEKGTYQHPELYGQPREMSMHVRAEQGITVAAAGTAAGN